VQPWEKIYLLGERPVCGKKKKEGSRLEGEGKKKKGRSGRSASGEPGGEGERSISPHTRGRTRKNGQPAEQKEGSSCPAIADREGGKRKGNAARV